ncbi:hypothetical protein AB0O01_08135 [Streptomyces sp. NPDC093252]|uniref:hypothetical protein n=1 Tax=Streptomyces sp. NPDC093252 TaxID=3154980 RepID=UPI0034454948
MNAGVPPDEGMSRVTIETYRVGPDGKRISPIRRRTYRGVPGPLMLASHRWPPCRCPRCRTGDGRPDVP